MQKRGQVTMFIILGLSVLIILLFAWFFKDTFEMVVYGEEGVKRVLSEQLISIDDGIKGCVDKESLSSIKTLLANGGTFNLINPINYDTDQDGIYGEKVRVLCSNIVNNEMCLNSPVLKRDLEKELEVKLGDSIKICSANVINGIKSNNYEVEEGDFNLKVDIESKNVLFNINYPLNISRKGISTYKEDFSSSVEFPLNSMVEVINHNLNAEALGEEAGFDDYSLNRGCKVISETVGNYKVYEIQNWDYEEYPFWFAVEGGS